MRKMAPRLARAGPDKAWHALRRMGTRRLGEQLSVDDIVVELRAVVPARFKLPDDASQTLSYVRVCFEQHVVCTDASAGSLGLLSGEPLSAARSPEFAAGGEPRAELVRRWYVCEADPSNTHVRYAPAAAAAAAPIPTQLDLETVRAQLYGRAEDALVAQLKAFLKAHNAPISENKPELVQFVKKLQGENRKYGIMHVRDPESTVSLGQHLIEQGLRTTRELPQYDEQLAPPAGDSPSWHTARGDVEANAPLLSKSVILDWAEHEEYVYTVHGATRLGESRAGRAARTIRTSISTHPTIDHHGRSIVWLREKCREAKRSEATGYADLCPGDVWLGMVLLTEEQRPPHQSSVVLRALCECKKGKGMLTRSPHCTQHCSCAARSHDGWCRQRPVRLGLVRLVVLCEPVENLVARKDADHEVRPYSNRCERPAVLRAVAYGMAGPTVKC